MSQRDVFKAYKVTNRLNGRAYIGITRREIRERWGHHISWAKGGRKGVLADAIRECGQDVFSLEHLASALSWDDLCSLEQVLIAQECTLVWDGGYNVTEGGEGSRGYLKSEAERQAISAKLLGVPKSPEHRAKLALAKTGQRISPEAKAKMSASHRGKPHSPEHVARQALANLGQKRSAETRAKVSAARTGQKASAETRAKLSAQRRGRKLNLSPEQRAARSVAHTGLRRSVETRAKLSAIRRACWAAKRIPASEQGSLE